MLILWVVQQLQTQQEKLGPVLVGWNSCHTNELCSIPDKWVSMVAVEKKLPRKTRSRMGYGKKEAAIVLQNHLKPKPTSVKVHCAHILQQTIALQFCLNFGKRSSTYTHVKLNQLKIHCKEDFKWEVDLIFDYFKGNNNPDEAQDEE